MGTDRQHGHGHTAWSIAMNLQYDHGNAAWTSTVHATRPCPCCVSISMLHADVHAACLRPCFMFMSVCVCPCHCPCSSWTWTCSMDIENSKDINMQHGHEHAEWPRLCSMDIHHRHGHAAWTSTNSMDLNHAVWTWTFCISSIFMLNGQGQVYAACLSLCSCCMSIFALHVYVHIAYPCQYFLSQYMLRVRVCASCHCPGCRPMSTLQVYAHAACAYPSQHLHIHVSCSSPCSMYMDIEQHGHDLQHKHDMKHGHDMQHGHGRAAWTEA
jgi:hypothetical protein